MSPALRGRWSRAARALAILTVPPSAPALTARGGDTVDSPSTATALTIACVRLDEVVS
ncbi:hypothetical protein [Sphaerisporangium sp. NPDC051011]|uniref:hypothetical protein n=1 Tax=Sphaerisporangium sp. NPDC051011 TaxID=3155792 RepID=UPI0033D94CCA